MIRWHENEIDFVMIWVDGGDKNWLREKAKYDGSSSGFGDSKVRYRDWDNLQFWFRGAEKFAPWVRKIHFVTWGHLPKWLEVSHPKLHIVNHKDYIPKEYLPTFNSHTIELNLHRIPGLAENFVYFNDDMFLTSEVRPEDFFIKGCPRDTFGLNTIYFNKDSAGRYNYENLRVINRHFDKKECLKRNFWKWYSPRNGLKRLVRTTALLQFKGFPGFFYQHLTSNFNKSTFEKLWEQEYELLDKTSKDRFRMPGNVNQWLFKYWQMAEGNFIPRSAGWGKSFFLTEKTCPKACEAIRKGTYQMICLNDIEKTVCFEKEKEEIKGAFEALFPETSSFEKKPSGK